MHCSAPCRDGHDDRTVDDAPVSGLPRTPGLRRQPGRQAVLGVTRGAAAGAACAVSNMPVRTLIAKSRCQAAPSVGRGGPRGRPEAAREPRDSYRDDSRDAPRDEPRAAPPPPPAPRRERRGRGFDDAGGAGPAAAPCGLALRPGRRRRRAAGAARSRRGRPAVGVQGPAGQGAGPVPRAPARLLVRAGLLPQLAAGAAPPALPGALLLRCALCARRRHVLSSQRLAALQPGRGVQS